ncbi:hypothetical protein Spirs_0413 [Sediminispirochaeta smaragdinae DSM 11293]|uniref:Uncharacterized protein n=2 Tax=Sediminispirochaeta TaxID=1911556 RepID=E1RB35_SEDSS|nr:hypothetical protein Spirs_0413 [Sediminispirochaeta smaragdinae DSM 11293]
MRMESASSARSTIVPITRKAYRANFYLDPIDGQVNNATYSLRNIYYHPLKKTISPDGSQKSHAGSLSLFRAFSRTAWLKTFRADAFEYTVGDTSIRLLWNPTPLHNAKTQLTYTFSDQNYIDIHISIECYGYYPDYELVFSNYLAEGFNNTVLVRDFQDGVRQAAVHLSPVFKDTFVFFPRDEQSIHTMTDGRHFKGHWYWNCSYGREYAVPLVASMDKNLEVVLMGLEKDVHAVGATYSTEDGYSDDVLEHHAQYLRLFGEDFTPGMGRQTYIRCFFSQSLETIRDYQALYADFEKDYKKTARRFELPPTSPHYETE